MEEHPIINTIDFVTIATAGNAQDFGNAHWEEEM